MQEIQKATSFGSQCTLYNSLQYTSLSSLGRVSSRLGPGPPANPAINYHSEYLLTTSLTRYRLVSELYSLGSDPVDNTALALLIL
jgi:hypothetical protein